MLTADVNLNEFRRSMNSIVTKLNVDPRRVLEKEVGELVKTLVRLSPPKNLAAAKRKSEKDVRAVYRETPNRPFKGKKIGRLDIRWLYATPNAVVGVRNYNFNEDYSVANAKTRLYQRMNKMGDKAFTRLGTRGKGQTSQAVHLLNRKIVKKQTYQGLKNRIKGNFGRQKAAWMVGVGRGQIPLTGSNMPPGWVRKHVPQARGDTINQLSTPNFPSFTLINRAVGVSRSTAVASKALQIRAKAMRNNIAAVMNGLKEY
ncbi:MAG: hypothetical protein QM813_26380 [Verrucomicrobiota bacterium]